MINDEKNIQVIVYVTNANINAMCSLMYERVRYLF